MKIESMKMNSYQVFVQSSSSFSKSEISMSLHLLTPGWIAPQLRKVRT